MKNLILLIIITSKVGALMAQQFEIDRSFLTIMAIPYTSPDESIKSRIEKDEVVRAVLSQVNRALEERGYRTKDYIAILRLPGRAPDASDLERTENTEAIRNSIVDVVIYVEIQLHNFSEGDRQIQLRLQAIDQYSGENYVNDISIESTRRRYGNFTQAVKEAQLINQLNLFTDQLDQQLLDVLKNGRTVTVRVSIKSGSKVNLNTLVDNSDTDLSGKIEDWIRNRAAKVYAPSGGPDYWRAECKLPLLDVNQRSVNPFSFRSELKSFLLQLRFSNAPLEVEDQTINSVVEMILGG